MEDGSLSRERPCDRDGAATGIGVRAPRWLSAIASWN